MSSVTRDAEAAGVVSPHWPSQLRNTDRDGVQPLALSRRRRLTEYIGPFTRFIGGSSAGPNGVFLNPKGIQDVGSSDISTCM